MNNQYKELDDLFANLPQHKTGNVQTRLRLSQANIQFLNDMEAAECDRNSIVNLALDMLRPKLKNYSIELQNLYNLVRK